MLSNIIFYLWTIWILPYDPFDMDYMLYSIKNRVEEFPEIEYNDGVRKLFLYTDGNKGGSVALKNLLMYIKNSREENAVDGELKKLHSNVERLKSNKRIGVKYMQMQEIIQYKVEEAVEAAVAEAVDKAVAEATKAATAEGRAEGRVEGEYRMAELTKILLNNKCYDDLKQAVTDTAYRETLFIKYNIA